ncbi:MAG: GNAT family N-acetyltransferase [Ktedonobacterales bacterium]
MTPFRVRPATAADLPAVHAIWLHNDAPHETPQLPAPRDVLSGFVYEQEHGEMRVAEADAGRVIGFGGSVSWSGPRGSLTYLADLFIAPDIQSHGVGQAILRALPLSAGGRCVHASTDPRAAALYIRTGMLPLWPNFWLVADVERHPALRLDALPGADVELTAAAADDAQLAAWDVRVFGYVRSRDLAWQVATRDALPLWFRRRGATIGYGYIQRHCDESLSRPGAWTLGPIGAETPENARDCVCAAVRWAAERAPAVRLGVPAPHPALAPLIEAGCRIVYNETFLASPDAALPDVTRYLPSGVFM